MRAGALDYKGERVAVTSGGISMSKDFLHAEMSVNSAFMGPLCERRDSNPHGLPH